MIALVSENLSRLIELCRKHKVKSLSLIGSAARGVDFSEASDLDFVYEFDQHIPLEEYAINYFSFQKQLRELFRRRVDLVPAVGSRNQYFLRSIAEDKVTLYEA